MNLGEECTQAQRAAANQQSCGKLIGLRNWGRDWAIMGEEGGVPALQLTVSLGVMTSGGQADGHFELYP